VETHDIVWIGTGQATSTVVPALSRRGTRVAVIEEGRTGGTCDNYGCTPTKTLVSVARAAHVARTSGRFGIKTSITAIDGAAIMRRIQAERDEREHGYAQWLAGFPNVTFIRGHASFVDHHSVQVKDRTLRGETIVIHTGTRPRVFPVPGLETDQVLTNQSVLDLPDIPRRLIVVGGSYVGLEFSQVFRRLGAEVVVIEPGPHLLSREDDDIQKLVEEQLRAEGIEIRAGAEVLSGSGKTGDLRVLVRQGGATTELRGTHLLQGVGRVPNADGLDLERAGVQRDDRGFVKVDDALRTSVPHIYALGDVNGRGAFTHTSVHDGQVFLDRFTGNGSRSVVDRHIIYAMYLDPPLARVGLSEKEARQRGIPYRLAQFSMDRIARARERGETHGTCKILVDPGSGKLLGATLLGIEADEVISTLAVLLHLGIPVADFQKVVLPHPTVGELMPWLLDELQEATG